jgi:Protein of unknown function (DUF2867)
LGKTPAVTGKARRVEVTEDCMGFGQADYASTFEITATNRGGKTPEQWIRRIFESGPAPMRVFIQLGWRSVLGFRLGPRPSSTHVLGWKITKATPELIALDLSSPFMSARKVLRLGESRILMTTFVRYNGRWGRALWSAVTPIHHRTEPYLLGHAVGSPDWS